MASKGVSILAPKATIKQLMNEIDKEKAETAKLKPLNMDLSDTTKGNKRNDEFEELKSDFVRRVAAGEFNDDDPVTEAFWNTIPEEYLGTHLVSYLFENLQNCKVNYILEHSFWSQLVDSVDTQTKLLKESNSYLSRSNNGVQVYELIQEDYNFLFTEEGYHWADGIQKTLDEMPAEIRMRYRLAEKDFLRVNRYHSIRERVGSCMEAALSQYEMPKFQMNPFTREVLREERSVNSTSFYQSLIDVSKESLMDTAPTFNLFEDACASCSGGGDMGGDGGYTSDADPAGPEAGYDLPLEVMKPKRRKQASPNTRKRFSLKDFKAKYSR